MFSNTWILIANVRIATGQWHISLQGRIQDFPRVQNFTIKIRHWFTTDTTCKQGNVFRAVHQSFCLRGWMGISGTLPLWLGGYFQGASTHPPPHRTSRKVGYPHPPMTWNHEIRLANGRYTSYWNAFLFIPWIVRIDASVVHSRRFSTWDLFLSAGLWSLDDSPADFPLVRLPALLL